MITSMHGKEVKLLEELMILVKQGVVCNLPRQTEAGLGRVPFLPAMSPHSDDFVMEKVIQPLRVPVSSSVNDRFGLDDL